MGTKRLITTIISSEYKIYMVAIIVSLMHMYPCETLGAINWHAQTFLDYKQKYPSAKKHVLLYFYRENCAACTIMETRTFSNTRVVSAMSDLGRVQVNCDTSNGRLEADSFKVVKFPTMILLDKDFEEISRKIGLLPAREFITWLSDSIRGKNILTDYLDRLRNDPDNMGTLLAVARIYRDRMDIGSSTRHYRKLRILDPLNEHNMQAIAILELADLFSKVNRYKDAIVLYKIFTKNFPKNRLIEIVYLHLIQTFMNINNIDHATETFREYKYFFKDHYRVHYLFAKFCFENKVVPGEALDAAIEASRLNPNDVSVLELLAKIYWLNGEFSKARFTVKKGLSLVPGSSSLQKLDKTYRKN